MLPIKHYRAILITSDPKKAGEIVEKLDGKGFYICFDCPEDRKRLEKFMETCRKPLKYLYFPQTQELLGTTYDFCVVDLHSQLVPNDIGIIVETIRGGGLIIFLAPPENKWVKTKTFFHKRLVTPPFTLDDVKTRFIKRFVRKLKEHKNILWIDEGRGEVVEEKWKAKPIKIPEETLFPKALYRMCLTQDQINTLKIMEKFWEKGERTFVLTADRGRGKSAVLGLGICGFVTKLRKVKAVDVLITAPDLSNVQVLFEFVKKGFDELGTKYEIKEYRDMISEIVGKNFKIAFWSPLKILEKKGDLVVVDEAAGIPVEMLFKIKRTFKKTIFSSTIHGYEGAGRGFSIKFMRGIGKAETYEMEQPIRYGEGDPIEKWLYDALLLDAEPPKLKSVGDELEYIKPNLDEWIEQEEKLREFIGIYILAHYRNQPNDLALLLDSPHHIARALAYKGHIVCSAQLAVEGGFSDREIKKVLSGYDFPGGIIPDRIAKHYVDKEFPKLKGFRIVRIATHPNFMRKGIGSRMLKEIEKEAMERGLDWVGASFGASGELVNFWVKNRYIPIHLSPARNPNTGEYSMIVVKPISEKAMDVVERIREMAKRKWVEALGDTYRDLEPSIAKFLFSGKGIYKTKINKKRFGKYLEEVLTYESVCDVLKEIAKKALIEGWEMDDFDKQLLIAKTLQGKTWEEVGNELKKGPTYCIIEMRHLMKKLGENI